MSIASDLQTLRETLKFYAEGWEIDPGGPGETTLFGTEFDRGKLAASKLQTLVQLERKIEHLQKELCQLRAEKKQQVTVISGIGNQIWLQTWLATQRIPMSGAAWAGYLQLGSGIVVVQHRWVVVDKQPLFEMNSGYWGLLQIEALPQPFREELLMLVNKYQPEQQAVITFIGQDLSHDGKRHPFRLDRNYYQIEVVQVNEGETVPDLARQLGIEQQSIPEAIITLEAKAEDSDG
jgi:hypothetical protein